MRAVALVDGEHYPPVTLDAIDALRARGFDIVAAVMLGGTEKLKGTLDLGGLPVVIQADRARALEHAIDEHRPDTIVDISDAPVLDTRGRFALAARALARGVAYEGAGFRFDPPPRPVLASCPIISVIGTGKRTGKTAVAAALARWLRDSGRAVVIVAMGRGGPAEPVVTKTRPSVEDLVRLADAGEHAATDSYEDAVMAGVTTVGARRAGAGVAGGVVHDTVARAVAVALQERPDILVLEGSGTAIPPAHADATVLVVGGATPPDELDAGLGLYRLLISDLAVVTMAEEPVLSAGTLSVLSSLISDSSRDVPIVETVFRPTPMEPIAGARVFVATTAPEGVGDQIRDHLETHHGARVVGITHRLSNRPRLSDELTNAEGTYEVLLTELKAAAIDVAARSALRAGARVVFADNEPVATTGALAGAFAALTRTAEDRARERG